MSDTKQKIVIVGGGFAGVKTALELANDDHFAVMLISPHGRFEYHGAMYRSATGRSPLEVVVPMEEIFRDTNVEVVLDSITELRPDAKDIEGESGRTYAYDTLIMAVGYVVNYFGIAGMAEYAESMYSISEAIKLRHRLVGAFRMAKPNEPVQVTVIGAGATGVEIASDIKNFAKIVEGKHGLMDLTVQVRLIEASNRVLSMMQDDSSEIALDRLHDIGVDVQLETMVTRCNKDSVETNKGTFASDVTIWTAGNKANPLFAYYPDVFDVAENGRVKVNDYFQSNNPDIYVIGDAADTKYSGMAQTAIHNASAVAEVLKRTSHGMQPEMYKPKKPEYVVPIGGEWALLEADNRVQSGSDGWRARREADRWVLENFLVYELADKHYKEGERIANF